VLNGMIACIPSKQIAEAWGLNPHTANCMTRIIYR
jgi:hypothetical protein